MSNFLYLVTCQHSFHTSVNKFYHSKLSTAQELFDSFCRLNYASVQLYVVNRSDSSLTLLREYPRFE